MLLFVVLHLFYCYRTLCKHLNVFLEASLLILPSTKFCRLQYQPDVKPRHSESQSSIPMKKIQQRNKCVGLFQWSNKIWLILIAVITIAITISVAVAVWDLISKKGKVVTLHGYHLGFINYCSHENDSSVQVIYYKT